MALPLLHLEHPFVVIARRPISNAQVTTTLGFRGFCSPPASFPVMTPPASRLPLPSGSSPPASQLSPLRPGHLQCGSYRLALDRPLIMGVVNVTPDSFSDGGQFATAESAAGHARRLIDEGADIVDIGGESTRPGAAPVSVDEERRRVLPVLERLAGCGVPVSIDTRKAQVMREAIAAGASMVNDMSALEDPEALEAVAAGAVAVCLMHKQGEPQTMQQNPHYDDVVREVREYLETRVRAAETAGIARERIVIDPGFGFGKTSNTTSRCCGICAPSRRSACRCSPDFHARRCLAASPAGPGERVHASVAAALIAIEEGASVVRVHDVAATRDALAVWSAARATIGAVSAEA